MNRHFICTREEAKKVIAKQSNFWISNCECKLYNTNPNRVDSMDVCPMECIDMIPRKGK